MPDIGRNDPCHCGSGKKYKKCCEAKDQTKEHSQIEKQWTQAEKDFAKQQKEAEKKAAEQPQTASAAGGPKPTTTPSGVKGPKHQTIAAPKFNMPRRTGGG
jgi:hypothetical protein